MKYTAIRNFCNPNVDFYKFRVLIFYVNMEG